MYHHFSLQSSLYITPPQRDIIYIEGYRNIARKKLRRVLDRALLLLTSFKSFLVFVPIGTSSSQNAGNEVVIFYGRLKSGQRQTMRFRI